MSFSDPTPENMQAAADAFEASYGTGTRITPHHVSVLLRAGSDRISELEESQRVLVEAAQDVVSGSFWHHGQRVVIGDMEALAAALPPIPTESK